MTDQHKDKHAHTPKEIVREAMGVDLEKAAKIDASQVPVSQGEVNVNSGAPQPTQQEVAEQTQMDQDGRLHSRPDRDDKLINAGRGRHTTGRLGGVS